MLIALKNVWVNYDSFCGYDGRDKMKHSVVKEPAHCFTLHGANCFVEVLFVLEEE